MQKINFNFQGVDELIKLRLLLEIKLSDLNIYIDRYTANTSDDLTTEQKEEINNMLNKFLIEVLVTPNSNEKLVYIEEIDNYDYKSFDLSKYLNSEN